MPTNQRKLAFSPSKGSGGRPYPPAINSLDRSPDPKRLKDSHTVTPGNKDKSPPDPNTTEPMEVEAIPPETKEGEKDQDEDTSFETVEKNRKRNSRKVTNWWTDFTRKGVCDNNRPVMAFWNLKLSVEGKKIKDGKPENWIWARLKEFYVQAKARDETFV